MSAELLSAIGFDNAIEGMKTCTASTESNLDKLIKTLKTKVLRIGAEKTLHNPAHMSILEHCVYSFKLKFSRAVLQEIARHRIASLSVQSTRYALKKLLKCGKIELYKTEDDGLNDLMYDYILTLSKYIKKHKIKNDIAKYAFPEALMTECVWTINGRSLHNFLALRTSNRALKEIRELAIDIYNSIPENQQWMYEEAIYKK